MSSGSDIRGTTMVPCASSDGAVPRPKGVPGPRDRSRGLGRVVRWAGTLQRVHRGHELAPGGGGAPAAAGACARGERLGDAGPPPGDLRLRRADGGGRHLRAPGGPCRPRLRRIRAGDPLRPPPPWSLPPRPRAAHVLELLSGHVERQRTLRLWEGDGPDGVAG